MLIGSKRVLKRSSHSQRRSWKSIPTEDLKFVDAIIVGPPGELPRDSPDFRDGLRGRAYGDDLIELDTEKMEDLTHALLHENGHLVGINREPEEHDKNEELYAEWYVALRYTHNSAKKSKWR